MLVLRELFKKENAEPNPCNLPYIVQDLFMLVVWQPSGCGFVSGHTARRTTPANNSHPMTGLLLQFASKNSGLSPNSQGTFNLFKITHTMAVSAQPNAQPNFPGAGWNFKCRHSPCQVVTRDHTQMFSHQGACRPSQGTASKSRATA